MERCRKLTRKEVRELQGVINKGASTGREVRKAQAILLLDADEEIKTTLAFTGYSRRRIFQLRSGYLEHGISVIEDKREGKPKELLTKKQRGEITETIKTKRPSELGTYYQNYDHWTTGVLGEYIKRTYDVQYKSKTSYYLVFRQAKFTYHKPGRVYERRDEQAVQVWRNTATESVAEALREPNTVVLVEDEMVLSTQTTFQKIWLPQGEYPKVEVSNTKKARSVYGFLNIKHGREHAFQTKWQNMYVTYDVLGELRKVYPTQKILLLWDQAPWHKGSKAQEFIREDGNIETIYFPRAAPEENPQEHVWKSGRSNVSHNRFIQDIDKTTSEFVEYLNSTKFPYSLLGFSAVS